LGKRMGVKNVYIFDDGEAYGKGIADLFEEIAKKIGLNVVGHMTLPKQDDYTSELKSIIDLTAANVGGDNK
jgi:ABC-type branched-subunit amino acid transport system substrate-binding protein